MRKLRRMLQPFGWKRPLGLTVLFFLFALGAAYFVYSYVVLEPINQVVRPVDPADVLLLSDSQYWKIDLDKFRHQPGSSERWVLVFRDHRGDRRIIASLRYAPGLRQRYCLVELAPLPFGLSSFEADTLLLKCNYGDVTHREHVPNAFYNRSVRFQPLLHRSGALILASDPSVRDSDEIESIFPSLLLQSEQ